MACTAASALREGWFDDGLSRGQMTATRRGGPLVERLRSTRLRPLVASR
ncbi:hypothetical protein [Streptomyces sp. NPDC056244]